MKQGDIILAAFPFADVLKSKVRPCVIVSNDNYNAKTEDIIVCGITGNILTHPYAVTLEPSDIQGGALHERSCVKADAIAKIHKRYAIKTIGTISDRAFERIRVAIGRLVEKTHHA